MDRRLVGEESAPGTTGGGLVVIGLGPGGLEHVTIGALRELGTAGRLFARTRRHPAVHELEPLGFVFETFDAYYERAENFESLYEEIARTVVAAARQGEQVCYAVPGHPTVAESSVRRLCALAEKEGVPVRLLAGLSWLDAAWAELRLDPAAPGAPKVVDALDPAVTFTPGSGYLITQVHSRLVAGNLKLKLMEAFGDETEVVLLRGAGTPEARQARLPLYELDRQDWIDHLTSVYVPASATGSPAAAPDALGAPGAAANARAEMALDPLVNVMRRLRAADGCPWDKAQTHASLKPYVIEESYEVWEAIDANDPEHLCEELGDLLLQIVFHAQLAAEDGAFDMNDVVDGITTKMVRRHPHVFADTQVSGVHDVLVNWEQIKKGEKGAAGRESVLDGIPGHLPALMAAEKTQGRAAKLGFEWPDLADAIRKVWEEAREVRSAYQAASAPGAAPDTRLELEGELGDLLFAVVNVARFMRVNPEVALKRTISKFDHRFRLLEKRAQHEGRSLEKLSLAELEDWWQDAKKQASPS